MHLHRPGSTSSQMAQFIFIHSNDLNEQSQSLPGTGVIGGCSPQSYVSFSKQTPPSRDTNYETEKWSRFLDRAFHHYWKAKTDMLFKMREYLLIHGQDHRRSGRIQIRHMVETSSSATESIDFSGAGLCVHPVRRAIIRRAIILDSLG